MTRIIFVTDNKLSLKGKHSILENLCWCLTGLCTQATSLYKFATLCPAIYILIIAVEINLSKWNCFCFLSYFIEICVSEAKFWMMIKLKECVLLLKKILNPYFWRLVDTLIEILSHQEICLFDCFLSGQQHTFSTCRASDLLLRWISIIRKFLTVDATENLGGTFSVTLLSSLHCGFCSLN